MSRKLIQVNNIFVTKSNKNILQDISFDINSNDFVTIIGPNGAGKSMLIKCIMQFYKPTSGDINICDKLKIGYMPQKIHPNLMIPIEVKRFLTLGHRVQNKIYEEIVSQTSIEDLLDLSIHSLSGGQMQKVLMARALLKEPELLILDEPAQNLDISAQISFYKLLDKIYQKKNMSILMVSHDLHFVMTSSKKVICLFHHICCSGQPHIVAKDPAFLNLFGNDTAQILKRYQHTPEHINHNHDIG